MKILYVCVCVCVSRITYKNIQILTLFKYLDYFTSMIYIYVNYKFKFVSFKRDLLYNLQILLIYLTNLI